jgi:hypothetical protein
MKRTGTGLAVAASMLMCLAAAPATAQAPRSEPALSLSQAEHLSADLKQGMTVDEVQKLLGKPRRTALKSDANASITPSKGTLQWTYSWASASAQGSLRVDFISKSLEEWSVNSWEWLTY